MITSSTSSENLKDFTSSPPTIDRRKTFFSSFARSPNSNRKKSATTSPPTTSFPSKFSSKSSGILRKISGASEPTDSFSSSPSSSWTPNDPCKEFNSSYPPFSLSPTTTTITGTEGGETVTTIKRGGSQSSSRRNSISELLIEQGMMDSEWISLDPFDKNFLPNSLDVKLEPVVGNGTGGKKLDALNSSTSNNSFYSPPMTTSTTSTTLPPAIDTQNIYTFKSNQGGNDKAKNIIASTNTTSVENAPISHSFKTSQFTSVDMLKDLPRRGESLQSPNFYPKSQSTSPHTRQAYLERFTSSLSSASSTTASPQSTYTPLTPPSSRFLPPSQNIPSYQIGIDDHKVGYSPLHAFYSTPSPTKIPATFLPPSPPPTMDRSTTLTDRPLPSPPMSRTSTSGSGSSGTTSILPTTPTQLSTDKEREFVVNERSDSVKRREENKVDTAIASIRSSTPLQTTSDETIFTATSTTYTTLESPITITSLQSPINILSPSTTDFEQFKRVQSDAQLSRNNDNRRESKVSIATSTSSNYASVASHHSISARSSLAMYDEDKGKEGGEVEEEEEEEEEEANAREHSLALSKQLDLDLLAQEEAYRASLIKKDSAPLPPPKEIKTLVESPKEENFPLVVEVPSPRFEFALVIFPSTILVSLLTYLPYQDFKSLMQISKTLRNSLESEESKELVLQRYLGSMVGYKTLKYNEFGRAGTIGVGGFWGSTSSEMERSTTTTSSSTHGPSSYQTHSTISPPLSTTSSTSKVVASPLRLTLLDLQAFKVGQKYSIQSYAKSAAQHILKPLPFREVKRIRASTRAWNRVVLRLREQYELIHGENSAFNGWKEINVFQSISKSGGYSPVYKPGRAVVLRVWVPITATSSTHNSTPSNWMSDACVENCETEMRFCYPPGVEKVLVGDIVHNVSMGDYGNEGKLIFDGKFLRDFEFGWDSIGHLPQWMNMLAYPPGYYHNIIGSSTPNPIFFISLSTFISQIRENLALQTEKVVITTPHSNYNVKKFIYRSNLIVKAGCIIGTVGGAGGAGPGGIQIVHDDWVGTIVLETEGTTEMAVELIKRCEMEEGGAWRVVREKSRVGRLWLKLVGDEERVR